MENNNISFEQFNDLLSKLHCGINEQMSSAECIYINLLNTNGNVVVQYLMQTIQNFQITAPTQVLFSLILLKDIFIRWSPIFISVPGSDPQMQSFLMNLIDNPSEIREIQLNTANLVVTAAKFYYQQNQRWQSFEVELIQRCSSQNNSTASIALDCLTLCLQSNLIKIDIIVQFFDLWYKNIFSTSPSNSHLLIIHIIFLIVKNNIFCECFGNFTQILPSFILALDVQFLNRLLSDITYFTDILLNFFGPAFKPLFECFISIFNDNQRDKGTRELILEIICEICENQSDSKILQNFIEPTFSSLLNVMCEISGPDFVNEDYEDPTPRTSVENSLNRISCCFLRSFEDFPQFLFQIFLQYNNFSDSFEKVRTSYVLLRETMSVLVAFLQDGNACEIMVQKIIIGIQSQNAFCQIAALQLLSMAAKHLMPTFQHDFNSIFIPPLLNFIQSNPMPFAIESLSYIISGSKNDDIDNYVNELYQLMIGLIGKIPPISQAFVLKCISSLIEKTGDQISNHYHIIVPVLASVIQSNDITLILPSIQAFSTIGYAFKSVTFPMESFVNDAQKFIQLILSINRNNFTDEQSDVLNSALSAFVSVLGPKYPELFLQLTVSLLNVIEQPVNAQKIPLSSDRSEIIDEILIPNEMENQLYVYSRNQVSSVYRSLLTLDVFLLELGFSINPLIPKIIEIFTLTITYFFDSDIQIETITCLQALLVSLYENHFLEYSIFIPIIEQFINSCQNSTDEYVFSSFLDFVNLLTDCHSNCNFDSRLISLYIELSAKLLGLTQSLDLCDDDEKTSIYTKCSKLLKFITKCQNIDQETAGKLLQLANQYYPFSTDSNFGISGIIILWSGIVKNLSHDPQQFNEVFRFILGMLNYPETEVCKEAFISLSDFTESAQFSQEHSNLAVSAIGENLSQFDGDDSELREIVDAAVYALTCLFLKFPNFIQNDDIVQLWFNSLPLKGKKPPFFRVVYDVFCQLIAQNHVVVVRDVSKMMRVIAKAAKGANSSDQARISFVAIVKGIAANQQTIFEQAVGMLSASCQKKIQKLLEM